MRCTECSVSCRSLLSTISLTCEQTTKITVISQFPFFLKSLHFHEYLSFSLVFLSPSIALPSLHHLYFTSCSLIFSFSPLLCSHLFFTPFLHQSSPTRLLPHFAVCKHTICVHLLTETSYKYTQFLFALECCFTISLYWIDM